jgi:short-subunit dehydrogenase
MKTAVITGASNGIGYHTARIIAIQYHYQIIAIARNTGHLQQLKQEVQSHSPSAIVIPLTVDLSESIHPSVAQSIKAHAPDGISILINNAGCLINKPFETLTLEEWMEIYQVNLFGTVRMIQTCLPLFNTREHTHIVNIGSYGGLLYTQKFSGLSAYSSSKGALAVLTECLAEEFIPRKIAVNCLALGAVNTAMVKKAFPGFSPATSPEQIAEFIAWYACNGHMFMNGKVISVGQSVI